MCVSAATVDGSLVEEGVEAVVFFLGERIVFVIVATAAVEGESEPGRADGFGHVEDVVDAVFFGDTSSFAIDGVIAEKAASEFLFKGGVGEKVAGDLPDREVIVWDVLVEGFDDPISPGPHRAFVVSLEAIGVGVAGGFEPRPGHAFAVGRIGKVMFDKDGPGFLGGIGGELFDFFERGRKSAEVEGKTSHEGAGIGEGREFEFFLFEFLGNELVDCVAFGEIGLWFFDSDESPMRFVFGALFDPAFDQGLVGVGELTERVGRRHDLIGIIRNDAQPDLGVHRVAWDDGRDAVLVFGESALWRVEAKIGLAGIGIEAMAGETTVGEKRTNVVVEVDVVFGE